jgi:hypothetical protein
MVSIDGRWLRDFGAALEDAARTASQRGARSPLYSLVAQLAAKVKEIEKPETR